MVKIEGNTPKLEKESPSAQEKTNTHSLSEWAANQAYYGPGAPLLPPYLYSAIMAGHVPQTYFWAPPQPLMPPYGFPCTTIYSQAGASDHPAVPCVATPSSADTPSKSSDHIDQVSKKKLKMMDGVAVPRGSGNAESDAGETVHEAPKSSSGCGIDGTTEGIERNTGVNQSQKKTGYEGMLSTDNNVDVDIIHAATLEGEVAASTKELEITLAPTNVAGKSSGSPTEKTDSSAACGTSTSGGRFPIEAWIQDERQQKRERRRQANRESARRSRMRKQAENKELLIRYESLNVENMALKRELNQLTEDSEKLRLEHAVLKEKLDSAHEGQQEEMIPIKTDNELTQHNSAENSTGVNEINSFTGNVKAERESRKNSNSENKLQLLGSSSRQDAIAAV